MKARKITEAIKHLQPHPKKEVDKYVETRLKEVLVELERMSKSPDGSADSLRFFLEIIYSDRKQMIKDLMDEGFDPDDLLITITDELDNLPKSKHAASQQREINHKLKMMGVMFNLIKKNKDKIDIEELDFS